jgi:hypothetical protein
MKDVSEVIREALRHHLERASPDAGSVAIVVEELALGPPYFVVAVIEHPLAASGQFQMATDF